MQNIIILTPSKKTKLNVYNQSGFIHETRLIDNHFIRPGAETINVKLNHPYWDKVELDETIPLDNAKCEHAIRKRVREYFRADDTENRLILVSVFRLYGHTYEVSVRCISGWTRWELKFEISA